MPLPKLEKDFQIVPKNLHRDKDLLPISRLVMMELLTHCPWIAKQKRHKIHCFPGIGRIAKAIGVSERTVKRSLDELEAAGYFSRVRRGRVYGGKGATNLYELNLEKLYFEVTPVSHQNDFDGPSVSHQNDFEVTPVACKQEKGLREKEKEKTTTRGGADAAVAAVAEFNEYLKNNLKGEPLQLNSKVSQIVQNVQASDKDPAAYLIDMYQRKCVTAKNPIGLLISLADNERNIIAFSGSNREFERYRERRDLRARAASGDLQAVERLYQIHELDDVDLPETALQRIAEWDAEKEAERQEERERQERKEAKEKRFNDALEELQERCGGVKSDKYRRVISKIELSDLRRLFDRGAFSVIEIAYDEAFEVADQGEERQAAIAEIERMKASGEWRYLPPKFKESAYPEFVKARNVQSPLEYKAQFHWEKVSSELKKRLSDDMWIAEMMTEIRERIEETEEEANLNVAGQG